MPRAPRHSPPKLVLRVIDALAPSMLEQAVAAGAAPTLGTLMCPTALPRFPR